MQPESIPDILLTAGQLHASADIQMVYGTEHLEKLLMTGAGLRWTGSVERHSSPGAGGTGTDAPLNTGFPCLHTQVAWHLFAPLSPEDYAQALEWANTPAAIGVIHQQTLGLDQQLSALRHSPLQELRAWLQESGLLSEVQFRSGDQWWRWHCSPLGLQRLSWSGGPVHPLRELGNLWPSTPRGSL